MRTSAPTRAEVSDVANAILDGADAVMLSGETAAGKYPLRGGADDGDDRRRDREERSCRDRTRFSFTEDISTGVAAAAVAAADRLKDAVLVAFTESGYTARLISELRPKVRILALTPQPRLVRRMALYWGVTARHGRPVRVDRGDGAAVRRLLLVEGGSRSRGRPS